jgi:phosphoribosylglycinamide formyltransferase-1
MHNLVIFASGKGSNAAAIINYFAANDKAAVSLIVTNRQDAGVLEIAVREHIPFLIINRKTMGETLLLNQLKQYNPSLLILAGFLWKIPEIIIEAFAGRIVNIHPALLPAYGGKGMYGYHVHEAVLAGGDEQSGITIHLVNSEYDEGAILLQVRCPVLPGDTPETLAGRIHELEHFYYPRTIHFLLDQLPQ